MLHAYMFMQPGIPVLYSGDEIGQLNDETYHADANKAADSRYLHRGKMDWDAAARIGQEGTPENRISTALAALEMLRSEDELFSCSAEGSYSYSCGYKVFVPGFKLGGTIETTGAGDTFCASVLGFVLENGVKDLTEEQLTQMLRFANAAAYLVTTRKGAIRSMPEKTEVEKILSAH